MRVLSQALSNKRMPKLTDEGKMLQSESILNVKYGISGDRTIGAHPPVDVESVTVKCERQDLIFRSSIALQRPVLDPCMAVGFLPLPDSGLRVGQLVTMKWRIERLKDSEDTDISQSHNVSLDLARLLEFPGSCVSVNPKKGH